MEKKPTTNTTKRRKMTRKRRRIKAIVIILVVFLVIDMGVFAYKKYEEYRAKGIVQGDINKNKADKKKVDENGNEVIIDGEVNVYVINVGLGEAIFIDRDETEVLIDGGPTKKSKKVLDVLKKYVDGDLEYVINTDCKHNRCGGLSKVYDEFKVNNTIYARQPGSADSDKDYKAFREFINAANTKCEYVKEGNTANYSLGGGAVLTLFSNTSTDTDNTKNLSFAVTFSDNTLLALCNANADRMKKISSQFDDVSVVIAGQNGGSQSVSQTALENLGPKYFVLSTNHPSKNKKKYPSVDTMQIIYDTHVNAYSTYKSGTMRFTLSSKETITSSLDNEKEDMTITMENYME